MVRFNEAAFLEGELEKIVERVYGINNIKEISSKENDI
jgi:hypothetical protein